MDKKIRETEDVIRGLYDNEKSNQTPEVIGEQIAKGQKGEVAKRLLHFLDLLGEHTTSVLVWLLLMGVGDPFSDFRSTPFLLFDSLGSVTGHALLDALFRAFTYAELKFCLNDLPQGSQSHEERLTGHLLTKLAMTLEFARDAFKEQMRELYPGQQVESDFAYHDLSMNRNTGE